MAEKYALGIDLGTSTSEICLFRDGKAIPIPDPGTKIPIIPSLVAVNSRGDLLVGEESRNIVDRPGFGVREIKRKMGEGELVKLSGQTFRPEEISAQILLKLKRNAEERLGIEVSDVVLSVPAVFPDGSRQATRNAGEIAGLNILRMFSEPTAAALAFGVEHVDVDEQVVVFDFGGGTLDISVLEMAEGILAVKSSFGDDQLGGKDFDDVMMRLIRGKFLAQSGDVKTTETTEVGLKAVAERAKIALSRSESYLAYLASYGVKNGVPLDLDVEITRQEYEAALAGLLDRARDCVRQALKAGKVRPSAIDRVLLVGGTTYIPCVRKLVAELFGKEPKADVDPDLAVCMGASIQAALIQGMIDEKRGIVLMDAPSYGLGVAVLQNVGGRDTPVYQPLIPPNTKIPFSVKKLYSLMHTEQEVVEVRLYQDQKGTAKLPEDAIDTGIYAVISDIPVSETGMPHPIEVDFSYNKDHLVVLHVTIPTTGQEKQVEYASSAMRMSSEEKVVARQRAANLSDAWKQNPKVRQYQSVIDKADQLLTHIPSAEMPSLALAVSDLKAALATTDEERIEACGNHLIDLIFDMDIEA